MQWAWMKSASSAHTKRKTKDKSKASLCTLTEGNTKRHGQSSKAFQRRAWTIKFTWETKNHRGLAKRYPMRLYSASKPSQAPTPPPHLNTPLESRLNPLDGRGGSTGLERGLGGPLPHSQFLFQNFSCAVLTQHTWVVSRYTKTLQSASKHGVI